MRIIKIWMETKHAIMSWNSLHTQNQKHQQNTPLQRRRKKRNSLKDSIDNSSQSSDELIIAA
jgi:hypothetical protein